MLKFEFVTIKNRPLRILCLGAHSDDIEIGCGGSMLRILSENKKVEVEWVVFGADDRRGKEAFAGANRFLAKAAKKEIMIQKYKESFFPYVGGEIKEFFEELKARAIPDIIFTHYGRDLHQDHRLISELTWNTFRNHLILEYEIVKYDGDLGGPNFYVQLNERICKRKIDIIMESFPSQRKRNWFTRDSFFSIMRIRGVESNAPGRYAEGFYARKFAI